MDTNPTGPTKSLQYSSCGKDYKPSELFSCLGFDDNGVYWQSWYEMDEFSEECERLWQELRPLYEQLHAYVLRQLKEVYADHICNFPASGHIPAHLLGE